MSFPRLTRRRLFLAVVLGVLCLPAVGSGGGSVLHFFASFDESLASGPGTKTFVAFGGSATVVGPQEVFEVVFPTPDDGEVEVRDNAVGPASELMCTLDLPCMDDTCEASFQLYKDGAFSNLIVRFDDAGDTGSLGLVFDDNGNVIIDGNVVPLPLLPGETDVFVKVKLEAHVLAPPTWTLYLTGPTTSETLVGVLTSGQLSLGSIHFIRNPGVTGGKWRIDNVLVTSYGVYGNGLIPNSMFLNR